MAVLERPRAQVAAPDHRSARRSLLGQIDRLDAELVTLAASVRPYMAFPQVPARPGAPRLLSLGELEEVRDALVARVRDLRAKRAELAERQAHARALLERMLREPARHKWVRISNLDLGEPGCTTYHVRPRVGLIGMLAGWWHVKISSGCPLRMARHRLRGAA
jgi:hypothetical protein